MGGTVPGWIGVVKNADASAIVVAMHVRVEVYSVYAWDRIG